MTIPTIPTSTKCQKNPHTDSQSTRDEGVKGIVSLSPHVRCRKLSFLHAKQILDYYKKLCSGQGQVLTDLVQAFNEETKEGSRMTAYSRLLNAAVENLIGKKQEIGVASLFSRGGTTLQKEFYDGLEDFELITFLVLK